MPKIKLVILALFLSFSAFSQEKALPLKTILNDIAVQHQVTFNYIEDEIVVYALVPPNREWALNTKLDYIKKHTRLEFKAIGTSSYTVHNDKKLDKPLCGFLKDAESGQPIEAASVMIANTNISAVSNGNGYFELPVVSPNVIAISHQNYQLFSINPSELYKPGCPDILLIPVVNTLDEIIAQRYLTTGITKNADGTFRVTPKKFGILPGLNEPDVQQTMQQLPGINSEDETISNISVRGGTHDQNMFLWNGIRMFQTGHFFGLISVFNPALTQIISIAKNGTSAFSGESVSSLVDISTHSRDIEATHTTLSADMISMQCASSIKLSDRSSFGLSVRRSFTDKIASPTYKNYRDRIFQNTIVTNLEGDETVDVSSNEHFYFCDFTVQYQQKIGERHRLSMDAIGIVNSLIIDQFTDTAEKNSDLGQRNYGFAAKWISDWNSKHQSTFNAYVSYYNLSSSVETFSTGQLLEQENTVLDEGFRFSHSWRASPILTVNGGYQFNETGVTSFDEINSPFFSRNIKEILRTHVLVAESVIEPHSKKSFLKTGLRLNYFDGPGAFLPEIRVQFSQRLSKELRFEVLGEQKSQTMSQVIDQQQDFLGIEKRRWTLADNSGNPIQKSNQISLGLTYRENNWLVAVDNFYKEVRGITTSEQGFQNQYEFVSTSGNYRVLGSEILVQKNFGRFYSWLNYSVNDNRYDFNELETEYFPNNFELIHAVSGAAIYEWRSLKIALGGKWHSGRPVTTPASDIPDTTEPNNPLVVYNQANNTRLPDFFQMNFSASKDWKLWNKIRLQAGLSVINLFNTRNVVNRFYRVDSDGTSINRINTYSLERTPNVNVKIEF